MSMRCSVLACSSKYCSSLILDWFWLAINAFIGHQLGKNIILKSNYIVPLCHHHYRIKVIIKTLQLSLWLSSLVSITHNNTNLSMTYNYSMKAHFLYGIKQKFNCYFIVQSWFLFIYNSEFMSHNSDFFPNSEKKSK